MKQLRRFTPNLKMTSPTVSNLSDRLVKALRDEFDLYVQTKIIPAFSKALNLDACDLEEVYRKLQQGQDIPSASEPQPSKAPPKDLVKENYTENQLNGFRIPDLKNICGKLNISKSGNKAALIANILKVQNGDIKIVGPKVKQSFAHIKPVKIDIEKDDSGNLVFEDMVFVESYIDQAEKDYVVVGYKVDGKIRNLTSEKINRCHELGLKYNVSKINDAQETITLQKDEYGNSYFKDLVYDANETEVEGTLIRYVTGYKDEGGDIYPLDAEHKEICKRLGQHIK